MMEVKSMGDDYQIVLAASHTVLGNLRAMREGDETVEETAKRLLVGIRLATVSGMRARDTHRTIVKGFVDGNYIPDGSHYLTTIDRGPDHSALHYFLVSVEADQP